MRQRLVLVALAVTSMVAVAFIVPLAIMTRELARDRALNAAEGDANFVARLISAVGPETASTFGFRDLTIILPDDRVLGASLLPGEDLELARSGAAGSVALAEGVALYVPVVDATGEVTVVRAFVPSDELNRGVARSWVTLGALGAFLILIAVAVADRLGRSMVRPVEDLGSAARRLGGGDLSARVDPSGPPELIDVGAEFNELAERVSELLQDERETAADLSHRLRTPLTAARLDAESLPPGPDRARLVDDLDALERTVDHIIREVRRPAQPPGSRGDLVAAVRERAGYWEALAEEQQRTTSLTVAAPDQLWATVPRADLEAAIDAMLGNVFAHTDEGTAYEVSLEHTGSRAVVSVDDAGSGFRDDGAVSRGTSGGGSTGLGLDIARRTAEAAGGDLHVAVSSLGGARVSLSVPVIEG